MRDREWLGPATKVAGPFLYIFAKIEYSILRYLVAQKADLIENLN